MRRWLALLLLVFLPVQFTWAAVADHIGHLPAAAGQHGHGVHDHGPDTAEPGTAGPAVHLGCDHCHGHCVGMIHRAPSLAAQSPDGLTPATGEAARAGPAPAQPERPQWPPLA